MMDIENPLTGITASCGINEHQVELIAGVPLQPPYRITAQNLHSFNIPEIISSYRGKSGIHFNPYSTAIQRCGNGSQVYAHSAGHIQDAFRISYNLLGNFPVQKRHTLRSGLLHR